MLDPTPKELEESMAQEEKKKPTAEPSKGAHHGFCYYAFEERVLHLFPGCRQLWVLWNLFEMLFVNWFPQRFHCSIAIPTFLTGPSSKELKTRNLLSWILGHVSSPKSWV